MLKLPYSQDVPPDRRTKPSRFVRVLFNEALDDRLSSLALDSFREWVNGSDMDSEQFCIMVLRKAIRERGGIDKATRCRVVWFSGEAFKENPKAFEKGFAPYAIASDYMAYPEGN